jgi:hypothetical protein
MTIFFIVLYVFKRHKLHISTVPFPFAKPFLLLMMAWIISSIFSVVGFFAEFSNLVGQISQNVLLIWIIWEIIDSKNDFKFLFTGFTIIFLFSCIYALVENYIGSNPISEYEYTLISADRAVYYSYSSIDRGYRVKSFFEHCIGAGINWSMYLVFILILFVEGKISKGILNKIAMATAILCIPCIILTRQRSPLVFLMISIIACFRFKKKRFYLLLLGACLILLLFSQIISENISVFSSIFGKADVDGSSFEMRLTQFEAAFKLLAQSPVWGLGHDFQSVISNTYTNALLGMESIWLLALTGYGVLGTFAYVYLAYFTIIKLPYKYRSKNIFFLALAYWITYSISSVPGMLTYMYYMLIIYFIKSSKKYKDESINMCDGKTTDRKIVIIIRDGLRIVI